MVVIHENIFNADLYTKGCPWVKQGQKQDRALKCAVENFKLAFSRATGLASPASSPNLSVSSLARWVAAPASLNAQPSTVRPRYARPHKLPAKLDSDEFGNSVADQTFWLD